MFGQNKSHLIKRLLARKIWGERVDAAVTCFLACLLPIGVGLVALLALSATIVNPIIAIAFIAYGVLLMIAGIGFLRASPWGRYLAVAASAIAIVFFLIAPGFRLSALITPVCMLTYFLLFRE